MQGRQVRSPVPVWRVLGVALTCVSSHSFDFLLDLAQGRGVALPTNYYQSLSRKRRSVIGGTSLVGLSPGKPELRLARFAELHQGCGVHTGIEGLGACEG